MIASFTQPKPPDEPEPIPHVPHPVPNPNDPPSPNAPQPASGPQAHESPPFTWAWRSPRGAGRERADKAVVTASFPKIGATALRLRSHG